LAEKENAMHVKKNDTVEILTGDDKGKTGRVLEVLTDKGKVLIEGINRVYRHLKPSQKNPQGGRLSKEMPVDASNVLLYCPTCRRGVRIGHRYGDDGHKERFCRRCGNGLGKMSGPRPKYARQEAE
jgi:large subunit ribosomal protein L24